MQPSRVSLRALMDDALKESGLSQNAAAKEAGITGPRWRQIVNGRETKGGVEVLVNGPADTLARMAKVVGVTPLQLREAKRADAADALELMLAPSTPLADPDSVEELTRAHQQALSQVRRLQHLVIQAEADLDKARRADADARRQLKSAQDEAERIGLLLIDRLVHKVYRVVPIAQAAMEQNPGGALPGQSEESDT